MSSDCDVAGVEGCGTGLGDREAASHDEVGEGGNGVGATDAAGENDAVENVDVADCGDAVGEHERERHGPEENKSFQTISLGN